MGALNRIVFLVCAFAQGLVLATQNSNEPMVAFICGKPAMHREVNEWVSDPDTRGCWLDKKPILEYCQKMYPSHNITNVVEASNLVTIPGWPSLKGNSMHTHRLRPFRCIVDNFQSDALLVPQHCKFDHKHDQKVCKGFSHWEVEARDACAADGMHCESFGMLLNCGLGTFSGVEYVCCPNQVTTTMQPLPPSQDDSSDSEDFDDEDDADDDEDDEDDDEEEGDDTEEGTDEEDDDYNWESEEDEDEDDEEEDEEEEEEEDEEEAEDDVDKEGNLYELYLKAEAMPGRFRNEHQRFVAARQYMHKLQEAKNTQLMKEWTAARDHVNEVRKSDAKTAERLSKEITDRFQRLYSAYEQEDLAEKQQIVAIHQQHVQADLNQRKRVAMDKYLRALEKRDVMRISKNLRGYIKAEEKDVMHTVNHYGHVRATSRAEAARIHPHVLQHLKLCQTRMEEALQKLSNFPDIQRQVLPHIEEFMKKFDDIVVRIHNEVIPDPAASSEDSESEDKSDEEAEDNTSSDNDSANADNDSLAAEAAAPHDDDTDMLDRMSTEGEMSDDLSDSLEEASREQESEHDYERHHFRPAHQSFSKMNVQQKGLKSSSVASNPAQLGTTFAIAIGSVAVFVVLVVAVVMVRRRSAQRTNVTHGYVEVDPAASPEERHVANMQMNGYENPTYRYFEVQSNK
ncbi:amyloid-beta precursor-like protein isoform X2 [Babylonia areolata]|uniref:amyloid-beta precursor-like protein isoform X2 n=1 Tax=Babylonia areolata TaxID=304850 RepID=UPI003FD426D3